LTVNLAGTKTLLTSTDELLSSDIVNTVSRNTAKKCRATSTYTQSDAIAGNLGTSKFICIDLATNSFTIDG
jgi:glutathione peroxidase-family protein